MNKLGGAFAEGNTTTVNTLPQFRATQEDN